MGQAQHKTATPVGAPSPSSIPSSTPSLSRPPPGVKHASALPSPVSPLPPGPLPPPRPGHHPVPQSQCLLPQRELERRCTAACGNSSGASAPSSMKKAGEKSSSVRGLVLPHPSDRLCSIPIFLDARRHPPWNPKYSLANIRRLWCWSWSDSAQIFIHGDIVLLLDEAQEDV